MKFVYILIVVLILMLIWQKKEHLIVPGVENRDNTVAIFLDDREWFDIAERDFYSRYRD
jgi:hypothetical protein